MDREGVEERVGHQAAMRRVTAVDEMSLTGVEKAVRGSRRG
jgi:hypothetical protein